MRVAMQMLLVAGVLGSLTFAARVPSLPAVHSVIEIIAANKDPSQPPMEQAVAMQTGAGELELALSYHPTISETTCVFE